jgi:hypothetical protein
MRSRLAIALVVLAGLVCAQASAYNDDKLAQTASVFAMQPVKVQCDTIQEDPELWIAWGYVYLFEPVIHTSQYLCEAAANVTDPSYGLSRRALGVLTVTHESYHLRKQWSNRGDEARVECKAIRHFRVAAQLLGASPELATELRAYALAWHWKTAARFPKYNLEDCKVPRP